MAGAIPTDNNDLAPPAATTLANAKAAALSTLRQNMPGYTPMASHAVGRAPGNPGSQQGIPMMPDDPSEEQASPQSNDEPPPGLEIEGPPPPNPKLAAAKEDNTEYGWDSFLHFARDTVKGTGNEILNVLPRAAAKLGGFITKGIAGAASLADATTHGLGFKDAPYLADKVFDFKKNYVDSAIDSWTPERASVTGEGNGSGPVAAALGSGLEVVPNMLSGGAGLAELISDSATTESMSQLDKGHAISTALGAGAVEAVANFLQVKVGVKPTLPLIKRVFHAMGVGDLIHVVSGVAKKGILYASGKDKEAAALDPLDGLASATVQNGVFGLLPGHTKDSNAGGITGTSANGAEASGTTPPEVTQGGEEGTPPPPPPAPESAAVAPTSEASPATPGATAAVPDTPTAEPVKDLKAQIADMKDKNTPRQGVFFSTENLAALQQAKGSDALSVRGTLNAAKQNGRQVQTPNGVLIVKNAEIAKNAQSEIQAYVDSGVPERAQEVIGRLTGAGEGKTADMTAVVQGHTPEGAVAIEGAVKPEDVPGAVQKVVDQGKTPVVTTPEEALARRETEINNEQVAAPAEPTPAVQKESTASSKVEPEKPEPKMGLYKPEKGTEVPVHLEEGASEGKTRIRPIDESTGEPSDRTIDVPSERVRTGAEKPVQSASEEASQKPGVQPEQAPASAPVKAKAPVTALASLGEVLSAHESQETPPPGKKFAAPLAERQDNASAFANVLRLAAKEAEAAGAESGLVQRAASAAKSAEGLTLKSKESTDKGRGTGHSHIDAVVDEMHKAARALLGEAKPGDEVSVKPKEAQLKAKLAAKRETPAEKSVENSAPKSEKIEAPIAKEHAGDVKPKDAALKDRLRFKKAANEFIHADEDEAAGKRAAVEQILHEMYGATRPKDEHDQVMNFLDEQRRDAQPEKKPRSMGDTVEEGEAVHDEKAMSGEAGFSKVYRPNIAGDLGTKVGRLKQASADSRVYHEWRNLTDNLHDEGVFDYLKKRENTGESVSAHFLMDSILQNTKTPVLKSLLTALRSRMPDLPIFITTDIRDLGSGRSLPGAQGLFHGSEKLNAIQLNLDLSKSGPTSVTRTIIHEMWHSATEYELSNNPSGQFAKAMDNALAILRKRMESKYGPDVLAAHATYFNDMSRQKPENYQRNLYGLTNTSEMIAEIWSNPEFMREVAESEAFASPSEGPLGVVRDLAKTIVRAIGNFFGVKDPRLLQHIMDSSLDVADAQKVRFAGLLSKTNEQFEQDLPESARKLLGATPLEAARAKKGLMALRDEAPPFYNEGPLRAALRGEDTDEPVSQARNFMHVVKSGSLDAIRHTVIALKTVGQIFRDHMTDFGRETDPQNPLRQLQEADISKNVIINRLGTITRPIAEKWLTLKPLDERAMSQLMIDSTMYKIDPTMDAESQAAVAKAGKGFEERHAALVGRFEKLSPTAQEVYSEARDANKRMMRELRRAGVDTALHTFEADLSPAQKGLLYGAKTHEIYDSLIGDGKLIDLGDRNDALKAALKDFAGMSEIDGPYFHLGRQGEYVTAAEPEGERTFDSKDKADAFAKMVGDLSPGSKATYAFRGGKHTVDFKAQYVSMHATRAEAEAERDRLEAAGLNPGNVTQKTMGKESAPLSYGLKELVSEAERKINKMGGDKDGQEAMLASLRSAFLQMSAARSAYAGSRLARKNVGGVKAGDMQRNFAEHSSSTTWHAAQMRTVFDQAAALGRLRGMARDAHDPNADQTTMYRRGQVVDAINKHAIDEVQNYGHKAPFNAAMAKLGFMSFLASPSHAAIWMTQNFTTGIPVGGARWGYGKAFEAFRKGMGVTIGPAMRSTIHAIIAKGGTSSDIHEAIVDAVRKDKDLGKWAKGDNSPLQQLIDRGVINHGYSNELGALARGDSASVARVFEWARLVPSMADAFNRVSTALAGLEMTGGDIRKTADFVQEIHADYSRSNKPLAFKKVNRVWGANSITMFKTYAQEMIHLVYGNLKASFSGDHKAEAAKTFAGVLLGNALFAGVYGAIGLEPLRLALYAYHKLADKEGEVWDLKTAVHGFLTDHFGKKAGNTMAYGLPNLLGADVSSRMGLADLFFHEPPDLLSSDKDMWKNFIFNEAGPMPQLLAQNVSGFVGHMQRGEPFQAVSSLVPIKAYQDSAKALQLFNTGKRDSLGGQMTKPSATDAMWQALGIKPASVAEAQEKASIRIEQSAAIKSSKDSILKQYASAQNASERNAALDRRREFNKTNPAEAIRDADLIKTIRRQQENTQNIPNRDARVNKATNF